MYRRIAGCSRRQQEQQNMDAIFLNHGNLVILTSTMFGYPIQSEPQEQQQQQQQQQPPWQNEQTTETQKGSGYEIFESSSHD